MIIRLTGSWSQTGSRADLEFYQLWKDKFIECHSITGKINDVIYYGLKEKRWPTV